MSAQLRVMARNLAAAMALSFQAKRLYPHEHPERKRRVAQLYAAWKAVVVFCPVVRFDFREARLEMGAQLSVALDIEICRDLITTARNAQLHEFTMHGPDAVPDALGMLMRLAQESRQATIPVEPVVAESVSPISAPDSAGTVRRNDQVEMLSSVWEGIAQHRQLNRDLLGDLARAVARTPGDGLLEPIQLRASRDPAFGVFEHSLNVAQLIYVAARTFAPGMQTALHLLEAALLADIGMLSVPSALVANQQHLEPAEVRVLRQHAALGARWLLATPGTGELAALVAFEHHMRSDGQGYPQTGRPWRPISASCLYQAADVYAALRSVRPYRPALTEDESRELLRKLATRWLDHASVQLLLDTAVPAGLASGVPVAHPA